MRLDSRGFEQDPEATSYGHCDEPSGSITN
jgi:hypothetical protein